MVVVGGGIVGLSAAIAMQQQQYSVALLDASFLEVDLEKPCPRVYAINQASQRFFETLGVWQLLDESRLSPYTHMHIWDAVNEAFIDFDSRMVEKPRLGTILEESVLKKALLQQCKGLIKIFPNCKVSFVETKSDCIQIGDGKQSFSGQLLIIADGRTSTTCQLLGVASTSWPYHQSAIVTRVSTEKPHRSTAYQVFHPNGPLAFLPLSSQFECSIVWSNETERSKALMHLSDEEFGVQLNRAFAATLGRCKILEPRHIFPLNMHHVNQYSGQHWLIMGDAAHTIHPLAGLGLNLGLADLRNWLLLMNDPHRMSRYQRQRKTEVWKMIALMGGIKSVFGQTTPPLTFLRGLGMKGVNQLLPLKRFIIEQAGQ